MDRKLLDILCCPTSKQPLALLGSTELATLNAAIAAGGRVWRMTIQRDGKLITPVFRT